MTADAFQLQSQADGLAVHVHTWTPTGTPRGLVQIHHGMAEHGARYAPLAEALTDRGFVVWAPDHRGHGQSVPVGQTHGHLADDDGWDRAVADLIQLNKRFRTEHPDLPMCLVGHSMGSFLTMQVLMEHGQDLAGVVLTGSNGHPGALRHVGALVVRIEERRLGVHGQSALIDKMSFGAFNKGIANPRTAFDWLSRDPDQVDAYVADPRCGFRLSTRSWKQFLHALRLVHRDDHIARIPQDLPVLICSGDEDPVGELGAGVTRLADAWRAAGMTQVSLHLVPGARHEVFNETDRDETIALVAEWLEARIGG
jgi:alpha-beta hydrolase superfamily lysophospholipase